MIPLPAQQRGLNFAIQLIVFASVLVAADLKAQVQPQVFIPESRELDLLNPNTLPRQAIPAADLPSLPSRPAKLPETYLSLDDAIRIALENARVIRVLGGQTAASSGRTIYDVASTQTLVEQQKAVFDPTLQLNQSVNQVDSGAAGVDPLDPLGAQFFGTQSENYNIDFTLSKRTQWGGTASLNATSNPTFTEFGIVPPVLNPSARSTTSINLTQPLLNGGGRQANLAPLLVARIDTDRSFFQYKDSVQELVRGVIEAYWSLVFARTDLWARENQVQQARWALELTQARGDVGFDDLGTVSQAEVALLNFQATRLSSEANVMQREEALRNILGLPLYDGTQLVPTTEPVRGVVIPPWESLLELAERNRPDIIELKLILEADRHRLAQARNQAQPSLNAIANYRWNGIEGTMRNGATARSGDGQFSDWTLGVNFSVPLGLRQGRANVRQQELLLARDRANLEQGVHAMVYNLSLNYRNLDLSYSQYDIFQRSRTASRVNLDSQLQRYQANLVIFLNVLQAISDWGNSVSAEAQALTQYNTQLATLERQTGTVLESHGIRFYEERFEFAGPLYQDLLYPTIVAPTFNAARYGDSGTAAEESFDLEAPELPSGRSRRIERPPLIPGGGPTGEVPGFQAPDSSSPRLPNAQPPVPPLGDGPMLNGNSSSPGIDLEPYSATNQTGRTHTGRRQSLGIPATFIDEPAHSNRNTADGTGAIVSFSDSNLLGSEPTRTVRLSSWDSEADRLESNHNETPSLGRDQTAAARLLDDTVQARSLAITASNQLDSSQIRTAPNSRRPRLVMPFTRRDARDTETNQSTAENASLAKKNLDQRLPVDAKTNSASANELKIDESSERDRPLRQWNPNRW